MSCDLALPRICPACMELLAVQIEAHPKMTGNFLYCPHHRTLAIVRILGGRVTRWSLDGPVTLEWAKQAATRLMRTHETTEPLLGEPRSAPRRQ